ncbi:MAG: ABC transporter permease, partial [Synergistaceae bacterium]|nr:ABC transporter permease [Synergistaceae bacterium]
MSAENATLTARKGFREFAHRLRKNPLALFGFIVLSLLVLVAIFAPVIAPYGYSEQHLESAFEPPSSKFLLGADEFGRDILSRLIYGARVSLQVGFVAVGLALVVGGFLGALAGYYGGFWDNIIMRAMDI